MPFPVACYPRGCRPYSSAFAGVLDAFEAALTTVICPAKRLLTSYTGAAIRVKRLVGGEESDIQYDANGDLDLAALATFMAGDTPKLRYVYPQVGSNKLGQATALSQPTLGTAVSQWGGIPAMVFGGAPQTLSFDSGISPTGLIMGVHSTSSAGLGRYCSDGSGNSSFFETTTNSAFGRWGNTDGQVVTNFANTALAHQLEMWYNGASSIIRIDTTEEPSAATAPLNNVIEVGSIGGGQGMIGSVAYMLGVNTLYDSTQRAALRAALAAIFPFAT